MKPRLLIITNLYPTPWDHHRGTFNFQQFNHLAKHMEIRVIVPISWKERLQNLKHPAAPFSSHPLMGKAVYPLYWYIPGLFRGSYGASMQISLQLQCSRFIRDFSPDFLLSSWAYPEGTAGTRIARKLGIPAFVKVHGSDINIAAQQAPVQRHIEAWGNEVAGVVSVSVDLKKKMQRMGIQESKIHVIYNGINHQRFHPLPQTQARKALSLDDSRIILYVGNLKKEKGCLDLLEAYIDLAHEQPDLKLYVAGTGAMSKAMMQRSQEAGMKNRIFLLGKVDHAALNHWYNAADLVCLPSYNEGVPNVLLEAMACGTPVVATRVGGIPEVVTADTGILVESGNVGELKAKLDTALKQQWNAEHIHQYTKKFSWNENIRQMLDMFNNAGNINR
ncbi:glycosyltransferase family 4 protein [Thiolapillus sp.]